MRAAVVDGRNIRSEDDLHDRLAEGLGLPDFYGRNLDALEECLSDLDGPASVILSRAADLVAALGGGRFEGFDRLFREIAAAREDFSYVVRD